MRERRKKWNNGGFTLVELIVVILIVGIVSAGAVISLSTINRAKANGCTEKLVKLLDQTRIDSMSRVDGAVELVISKNGNAYYGMLYVDNGVVKDTVELGDGGLTLEFWKDDELTHASTLVRRIDESSAFTIKFNKGNGSLHFSDSVSAENPPFDRIVITGSNTRTIRLYEETGRYRLQ